MWDLVGNPEDRFSHNEAQLEAGYTERKSQWLYQAEQIENTKYRKVPKFSDARKLCCNLSKIETKRPNLRVFCQNDANGIANSEDPDQTAPLGAV